MNYKKHIPWAITLIIVFLVIKSINNYTFIASIISDFLSTIMPFIVGVILAYALNPIMRFFETKYKLSRAISILLTFILVAILISTCLLFIIPVLLENIVELGSQIPVYIQQVETFLYENLDKIDKLTNTDVTTFVSSQLETLI
ncbi:MAG: AI-2E family transporter, partial [Romboutsia sp.]|nr:AI-2E family transporter [Romboutsia sp.]